MRPDPLGDPGSVGDPTHDPAGGVTVQPVTVGAEEHWTRGARKSAPQVLTSPRHVFQVTMGRSTLDAAFTGRSNERDEPEEGVMRVSELMHSPAVTCAPTTTLREVGQLMARRHVGSVIVIDQVGEVAGIVTDRDIVLRGVAQGRSADVAVETLMTRNVATIDTHADVADAAATMMKRRVRRLPVVDELGHAHGVVTIDDMVRDMGRQADEVSEVLLAQSSTPAREA
jgi:signal-transduction protein with cAMP-binding, CBS, and nucleotidyltransferase domain